MHTLLLSNLIAKTLSSEDNHKYTQQIIYKNLQQNIVSSVLKLRGKNLIAQ